MPDGLGSVRLVMTSTGSATFSAGYEPYGEEYDVSGSALMTYAGAVYDQATGLYLMGARYYSPQLQRFITADSYSGTVDAPLSLNRYAYVGDSPVTYRDPTGHSWWSALGNLATNAARAMTSEVVASDSQASTYKSVVGIIAKSIRVRIGLALEANNLEGFHINIIGTTEIVVGLLLVLSGDAAIVVGEDPYFPNPQVAAEGESVSHLGVELLFEGIDSCQEQPLCMAVAE